MRTNKMMNWLFRTTNKPELPKVLPPLPSPENRLQPGDWVRVKSKDEIDATLNNWRQLRGCTFMPQQARFYGTTQRVLKRLERFVDERDLNVKTANGIVLLEGVFCEGTTDFGRCDRCCVLFWREEWLEKIDQPPA